MTHLFCGTDIEIGQEHRERAARIFIAGQQRRGDLMRDEVRPASLQAKDAMDKKQQKGRADAFAFGKIKYT